MPEEFMEQFIDQIEKTAAERFATAENNEGRDMSVAAKGDTEAPGRSEGPPGCQNVSRGHRGSAARVVRRNPLRVTKNQIWNKSRKDQWKKAK